MNVRVADPLEARLRRRGLVWTACGVPAAAAFAAGAAQTGSAHVEIGVFALVVVLWLAVFPGVLLLTWRHALVVSADGLVAEEHSTFLSRRTRTLPGRLRDARAAIDSTRERYAVEVIAAETMRFGVYESLERAERDAARLRAMVAGSSAVAGVPDMRVTD